MVREPSPIQPRRRGKRRHEIRTERGLGHAADIAAIHAADRAYVLEK